MYESAVTPPAQWTLFSKVWQSIKELCLILKINKTVVIGELLVAMVLMILVIFFVIDRQGEVCTEGRKKETKTNICPVAPLTVLTSQTNTHQ